MKTYIISAIVYIASIGSSVLLTSQNSNDGLSPLLTKYYAVKNALVSGDALAASKYAAEFGSLIAVVDSKKLSTAEQTAFKSVQTPLTNDAKIIADSKDIAKQRAGFSSFSDNMISLAKAAKLSTQTVYVDYCPMKKAYWLSEEKNIRNPYYGSSMLTCGSVKDTIK